MLTAHKRRPLPWRQGSAGETCASLRRHSAERLCILFLISVVSVQVLPGSDDIPRWDFWRDFPIRIIYPSMDTVNRTIKKCYSIRTEGTRSRMVIPKVQLRTGVMEERYKMK